MVRHPSPSVTLNPTTHHLTELETCIKILKHLPPSERPAMLDRISQKITRLSQHASSPSRSGSQRQPSQNQSDHNNEQQQLSAIERLVSAKTALEACGAEVPDMQPLIKQHMSALENAWPVLAQGAEEGGELEAFFAGLRRNEDKRHPPGHKATLGRAWPASVDDTEETGELETFLAGLRRNEDKRHPPGHKATLSSRKAKRGEKNPHEAGGFKAALASLKAEQRENDKRQSFEFETTLVRIREERRDEDVQHTREVDAAIARKLASQKDEDEYSPRGLEAAIARMRAADQFAELGLFGSSTSSNPPERDYCSRLSSRQRSFPLSLVKVDDAENYLSTSGLQYHLLFDGEANSYRVQEVREVAAVPAVERSDKMAFHVNAIRSVDRKALGRMLLRVDVELESGKMFDLVFMKAEDRMGFLLNVYQCRSEHN